jgi:hypothetical protein
MKLCKNTKRRRNHMDDIGVFFVGVVICFLYAVSEPVGFTLAFMTIMWEVNHKEQSSEVEHG